MEDLEKALEALALEEATLMRGEEEEEEEEKFENEEDAFSGKEEDNWDDSDNNSEGEDVPDAWDADRFCSFSLALLMITNIDAHQR